MKISYDLSWSRRGNHWFYVPILVTSQLLYRIKCFLNTLLLSCHTHLWCWRMWDHKLRITIASNAVLYNSLKCKSGKPTTLPVLEPPLIYVGHAALVSSGRAMCTHKTYYISNWNNFFWEDHLTWYPIPWSLGTHNRSYTVNGHFHHHEQWTKSNAYNDKLTKT